MQLFEQILNEMPQQFSTELFIEKMRERNVNQNYIQSGHHVKYLKSKCQMLSKRMYSKSFLEQPQKPQLTEESCIRFLKSKGYKILKPITEFKEI